MYSFGVNICTLTTNSFRFASLPKPENGIAAKPGKEPGRRKALALLTCQRSPKKALKFNTGEKPVNVGVAVHYDGSVFVRFMSKTWNGRQAVKLYNALANRSDNRKIVEDNDPAGYQAICAQVAKRRLGFDVLRLPPRSPELQPLDFSLWSMVERRFVESNARILGTESRAKYLTRLRRTIERIPLNSIRNSIDSMDRRVKTLHSVKGDVFDD